MSPIPRRSLLLVAIAFAVGHGTSIAQTARHAVAISIPALIGLRIVGPGTGLRSVTFDYASDPAAYLAAVHGTRELLPTATNRFADVQVNSNRRGRWSIAVVATPLTYVGPASGSGLLLEDIGVIRGVRSGLEQGAITGSGASAWYLASWRLSATAQQIASRTGVTGGWRSLGFNGLDYALHVDGDEDPGTFTTVVTYLLTAP